MSDEIAPVPPRRKILRLKLEKAEQANPATTIPQFVDRAEARYMVWCDGGDMPRRVYGAGEDHLAILHAKRLSEQTGKRFYVMRAWRGYQPE